ncbi:MAG: CRTAC1 family protein [Planctomycetota bacterium]
MPRRSRSPASSLAFTLTALVWACAPAAPTSSPLESCAHTDELRRIGNELYAGDCAQYGRALRERLVAELAAPELKRGERIDKMEQLAFELVEAGEVPQGISVCEQALALARDGNNARRARRLERFLAQAWLREAENQNCVARHNAECCIFPPREGALHTVREPAEKARALYESFLREGAAQLDVRWLVNVTTLLLGETPADLPEEWRLPETTFGVWKGETIFRDVAKSAGVDTRNLAGGVALEDFDGDGFLDILTSTCDPLGPLSYFRSRGDGTYEDRSEASGAALQLGGLNMISADYDEDGDRDALVLRGGWMLRHGRIPNSLVRNDEGEHWVDVTRAAGLAEPAYPTQAGVFGDFDGEGSPDLFLGNEFETENGQGGERYPAQLFQNDGTGRFTDIAAAAGVENDRFCKGVAAGDYDGDGDLDLYLSNLAPNRLYRNDGQARFEDVATAAGVLRPAIRSFATWFFDQDQDGRLDLWVTGYQGSLEDLAGDALGLPEKSEKACLYRNQGDGTFVDLAQELGLAHPMLAMGANYGDIDNDGWYDLYLATGGPQIEQLMPNLLLRNERGERFVNITAQGGVGHLQKGHGVGFGDLDNDGDQDIFNQLGGFVPVDTFQNALFENRSPPGNHWLQLSLEGTRTNRDGYGATVEVHLDTDTEPRVVYRTAGCVSSFGGSPHRLELGLGAARGIEKLVVRWPRSEAQEFTGVPMDAWLAVREGEARFERRELRSFAFRAAQ